MNDAMLTVTWLSKDTAYVTAYNQDTGTNELVCWSLMDKTLGYTEYNPRNLPSCIVHVDCDIPGLNGLEQRDQFGGIILKVWDYPLPDGSMFISEPLGINVMERTDCY